MLTTAEFIGKHSKDILVRWFDEASRAASSRGLERPEFTNIMPHYVSALSEAHTDLGTFAPARRGHIETHLASRIRQGFSAQEVVDELVLLGRCVEGVSDDEREQESRVEPADLELLRTELNRATAAVWDMFAEHMAKDEQEEKRYARLLRGLASDALQRGTSPLSARLSEALALIVEGVGANGATLLLYRPESMDLVSVATVGLDDMEKHVVGLDPSSFAGKIASRADATTIEDVATTQLGSPTAFDVAASIRSSESACRRTTRCPASSTSDSVTRGRSRPARCAGSRPSASSSRSTSTTPRSSRR